MVNQGQQITAYRLLQVEYGDGNNQNINTFCMKYKFH